MANLQPTYPLLPPIGLPGQVANGETSNRISRTIEDAAGVPFGRAVFRGTGDHGVTATPAAGRFMGVTIADPSVQPLQGVVAGAVAQDVYPQYATAGLLNEGEIFVTAGEAVLQGDAVYVTAAGLFVKTAGGNTAIPCAFDHAAALNGLVRLRVRRS